MKSKFFKTLALVLGVLSICGSSIATRTIDISELNGLAYTTNKNTQNEKSYPLINPTDNNNTELCMRIFAQDREMCGGKWIDKSQHYYATQLIIAPQLPLTTIKLDALVEQIDPTITWEQFKSGYSLNEDENRSGGSIVFSTRSLVGCFDFSPYPQRYSDFSHREINYGPSAERVSKGCAFQTFEISDWHVAEPHTTTLKDVIMNTMFKLIGLSEPSRNTTGDIISTSKRNGLVVYSGQ